MTRSASLRWSCTSSVTASMTSIGDFRTLYCADLAETCLREVLADFRPNLGALRRHVERYGLEAAQDFTEKPVTAQWRRQQVLVPTVLKPRWPLDRSHRRAHTPGDRGSPCRAAARPRPAAPRSTRDHHQSPRHHTDDRRGPI